MVLHFLTRYLPCVETAIERDRSVDAAPDRTQGIRLRARELPFPAWRARSPSEASRKLVNLDALGKCEPASRSRLSGLFPTGFQVQHATGSRRLVLPCCSGSPSENRCQATCERGAPPQPIRDIRCDRRRGDPPALSRAQQLGDAVRRVRQRAESAHGSKPKRSGSLPTARTVPHKRTSTICSSSASGASRTAALRAKLRQRSRGTSALAPNHPSGGGRAQTFTTA